MKYNCAAISFTNSSCAITLITGGKVPAIFTQVKVTKLEADICTYINKYVSKNIFKEHIRTNQYCCTKEKEII